MLNYLTIRKFSAESGYSEAAVRSKVRDGIWAEGAVWVRAPDGRILIDVTGYERWVESSPTLKAHHTKSRRTLATSPPALRPRGMPVKSPPPLTTE
jgi:hypothetical protein